MNSKRFRGALSRFVLVQLLGATVLAAAARGADRPNLLLVFPDQMRGGAMGFLGEEPVRTPNLDRLASESLVLTQAVSNYPVCSPYRAMLMTGKYPHRNGVLSNCNAATAPFGNELREADRCWSDVLKDEGYSLGYIGKWHLDAPREPHVKLNPNWNEWCPPERRHGFDFWHAYGTFDQHMTPMYWPTEAARDQFIQLQQWGPEHEADMAIKYLRNEEGGFRKADQPFALVVAMNPPHTPYRLVPRKYVDLYADKTVEELLNNRPNAGPSGSRWGDYTRANLKNYYAMISGVDDQFGRILKCLKDEGLEDNTIVLFTSDHGNCLGLHGEMTKNNHYDESMRIPFLIRWPDRIPPRRDDLLLSTPDIYPTLLDLMGLADRIPADVQGVSRAELFRTGEGERPSSALYLKIPAGRPEGGRRGVRTHRYTLMIDRGDEGPPRTVLFDNRRDPYQLRDIAAEQPALVQRLVRDELDPWLRRIGDPWRPAADSPEK